LEKRADDRGIINVCMNKLKGKVITGLGVGQYYISRDGYRKQFNLKLGFDPSPGTLNLKLAEPFPKTETDYIKIEGFVDESGTFGGCKCYRVMIGDIKGAIVRPERSNYPPNLIEVIAPVYLRKALNLKDGNELEMILE
jgi:riboflavin kinase, archaea type